MQSRFSVIVTFFNEEENIHPVLTELRTLYPQAEIIAVDDGSQDSTPSRLSEIAASYAIDVVTLPKNLGQSAAMYAGLCRATSEVIVTMDGDGQSDPHSISTLLEALKSGHEAALGYREKRQDRWRTRAASRIANRIRQWILGDSVRDAGCTLKAFRREHLRWLVPFTDLHVFIGAILQHHGVRCAQLPVAHRARLHGCSHYTLWGRAWRRWKNVWGVRWLLRRQIPWPLGWPYNPS